MGRILATIKFIATENGGRKGPLPDGRIGYVIEVDKQNFSCWLINTSSVAVNPGDTAQLEVVLLAPELAVPFLNIGVGFILKDYRQIATGVVDKVMTR